MATAPAKIAMIANRTGRGSRDFRRYHANASSESLLAIAGREQDMEARSPPTGWANRARPGPNPEAASGGPRHGAALRAEKIPSCSFFVENSVSLFDEGVVVVGCRPYDLDRAANASVASFSAPQRFSICRSGKGSSSGPAPSRGAKKDCESRRNDVLIQAMRGMPP
jgi:hypothetical protein